MSMVHCNFISSIPGSSKIALQSVLCHEREFFLSSH